MEQAQIKVGLESMNVEETSNGFSPYENSYANFIYNLLFCDNLAMFKGSEEDPWTTVLAAKPSAAALRSIADDESQESRVRALAYNRLRELEETVPSKKLLGVIVEIPFKGGLDVLAAFPDERVRYLNQSGKMAVVEGAPREIAEAVRNLIAVSQPMVDRIGPWDKPRLAPPAAGVVRVTFLVSDGLYFGEGPEALAWRDDLMGPVLVAAEQLLAVLVEFVLKDD